MQIEIKIRVGRGGTEFVPEPNRLHLGGQKAEGVDKLEFSLPAEWEGKDVSLYIEHGNGEQQTPVRLDEQNAAAVDRRFTSFLSGHWMLMATDGSGYTAYTKPGSYDVYGTLMTEGPQSEEPEPSLYEQFVARVLESANQAREAAETAGENRKVAESSAAQATGAATTATEAAFQATEYAMSAAESEASAKASAERAAASEPAGAAERAENAAVRAETAEGNAQAARTTAEICANQSAESAVQTAADAQRAELAANQAEASLAATEGSSDAADAARQAAEKSRDAAAQSASAAQSSQIAAAASQTAAAESAGEALAAASSAAASEAQAQGAVSQAQSAQEAAEAAKNAAASSQSAAAQSADIAQAQAQAAQTAKTEAEAQAQAAAGSAQQAAGAVASIDLEALKMVLTPPGTVLYFAQAAPPAGWLACNGAAVSRSTYAALFGAIGTTYGGGDGSSTFTLPDLRDKVPWGGTSVGTVKQPGLPNIVGTITPFYEASNYEISGAFSSDRDVVTRTVGVGAVTVYSRQTSFQASRSNAIYGASATVQPPALTLLPCIKY